MCLNGWRHDNFSDCLEKMKGRDVQETVLNVRIWFISILYSLPAAYARQPPISLIEKKKLVFFNNILLAPNFFFFYPPCSTLSLIYPLNWIMLVWCSLMACAETVASICVFFSLLWKINLCSRCLCLLLAKIHYGRAHVQCARRRSG